MEQVKQQPPQDIKKFMETMVDVKKLMGNGGIVEYRDRLFLPGFSTESVEYLREWEMPENSVVISSFPKTGTAWCTEIVRQILHGNDAETLQKSKSIPKPLTFLEFESKKKFDIFPHLPVERKIFSTHVAEEFFNFNKMKQQKCKMIYVMRNPKDQTVSWFHFTKRIPIPEEILQDKIGTDWNDFFQKYVNGEHPVGLKKGEWYPDHLIGWLNHKDDDSFLVVEYESLKKDFRYEVCRMAKFLEVDLSDDDINRIESACTVASMKKAAETDKSGFLKMNVRKGEVGGWRDQFTVSQSDLMDKLIGEKLRNTGIDFKFLL